MSLTLVETAKERALWRELVARYHYLGHRVPFGAHLRYLIRFEPPEEVVLGCLQFSSSAWRMQARDRWIGWDERARKAHLQRIVTIRASSVVNCQSTVAAAWLRTATHA